MSAALDAALRGESTPAPSPAPNAQSMPNAAPNTQPMPGAQPMLNPAPAMPPQPEFTNPFAEATEKNKEIRNVSFSSQDSKPISQGLFKGDKKRLIFIGAAGFVVLLIAILVIVMMAGNKPSTPTPTPTPTPDNSSKTSTAGDYLCEKTYLESELGDFENATAATTKVYFTFTKDGIDKIRLEQVQTYDDADAVKAAFIKTRDEHTAAYEALGATTDPVAGVYKRDGVNLRINYNASVLDLTNDTLKFFDAETTQVISTITSDDLQDLYEAKNYVCGTAPAETTE